MIVVIHDLRRRGLSISEIARRTGLDRKTVRKYLQRGLAAPAYGPRRLAPYEAYLRERVEACAGLSGRRLYREIGGLGYRGGYTTVTDYLRRIRPALRPPFERRLETAPPPPGPGGCCRVPGRVYRPARHAPPGVAVRPGAGPQPLAVGALLPQPEAGHRAALPRAGVRGVRRGHRRGAVRPDEDGGAEGACRRHRALPPGASGAAAPLRLRAPGVLGVSRQDQGQGGAAVPLHPPGRLPGSHVPEPGRPQRPVRGLVRRPGQRPGPRHHQPGGAGGLRGGAAAPAPAAAPGIRRGPDRRAPGQPRGHGLGQRQPVLGAGPDPQAGARGPAPPAGDPHLRGRRAGGPAPRRRGGAAVTAVSVRIRDTLVGLRMPRALEVLDRVLQRLEQGELSALDAIDQLLLEEYTAREGRRVQMALHTARLAPIKTLESFDFTFQPSLDRHRILTLAQLEFADRAEVLHLLGPPGTGKSHLATALGVTAVKAGKSVYRATLAELIEALVRAEREGRLAEKLCFFARAALLIIDEIGYLPITRGGANLFFQLVNAPIAPPPPPNRRGRPPKQRKNDA